MGDQTLTETQQATASTNRDKAIIIFDLIFAEEKAANHNALKRKALKKYWQNIKSSVAEALMENSDNHQELNFPRFKKSDSLDAKLNLLKESTEEAVQKAFKQAVFDVYRANQIKGETNLANVRKIVAAADELKVDYPSKYSTQHKTKAARQREVAFLKIEYQNKKLTRNDVIRLIKLADFNKQPRDLSGLNLTGCDLRGLDLRKTKFENTVMNNVELDENTKFKGSVFLNVKMEKVKIEGNDYNAQKLSSSISNGYQADRTKKINQFAKLAFFGFTPCKVIAEKFISNSDEKLKSDCNATLNSDKNSGDLIMRQIERSERGGRTNINYRASLKNKDNYYVDNLSTIAKINESGIATVNTELLNGSW